MVGRFYITTKHHLLAPLVVLVAVCLACTPETNTGATVPFQNVSVRFEQNATDGDVEVVFEITSGDEGLSDLTITGPDGRQVTVFIAPDPSTLGIRTFQFESPEPPDVDRLTAAYPEGIYRFTATTSSDEHLAGQATLNHNLPATATFIDPAPEGEDVSSSGFEMSWSNVPDVTHYIIEIEQDEIEVNLTARVTSADTTFRVPDGFLLSNTEYQWTIGTVSNAGNISYVETSFTTAR